MRNIKHRRFVKNRFMQVAKNLKPAKKVSIKKIFLVAFLVSFVCAVVVSTSSVLLKPYHESNVELEKQRNLLAVIQRDSELNRIFSKMTSTKVQYNILDLNKGEFLTDKNLNQTHTVLEELDGFKKERIPQKQNLAGIKYRPNYMGVYQIKGEKREYVILPIYGKGYASMIRGYLGLNLTEQIVVGLSIYEQEETPGIGSRITNEEWLSQWQGKKFRSDLNGNRLHVSMAHSPSKIENEAYRIDGITGATKTSMAMDGMLAFWLGDSGYQRFFKKYFETISK